LQALALVFHKKAARKRQRRKQPRCHLRRAHGSAAETPRQHGGNAAARRRHGGNIAATRHATGDLHSPPRRPGKHCTTFRPASTGAIITLRRPARDVRHGPAAVGTAHPR
jgi:hypothetical protein